MKRYGVPHPYPLPSLWRSLHQESSWADSQPYGIPISVGFLLNTPEIVIFRHFGLAMTFVACATQPQIEVLFHDF